MSRESQSPKAPTVPSSAQSPSTNSQTRANIEHHYRGAEEEYEVNKKAKEVAQAIRQRQIIRFGGTFFLALALMAFFAIPMLHLILSLLIIPILFTVIGALAIAFPELGIRAMGVKPLSLVKEVEITPSSSAAINNSDAKQPLLDPERRPATYGTVHSAKKDDPADAAAREQLAATRRAAASKHSSVSRPAPSMAELSLAAIPRGTRGGNGMTPASSMAEVGQYSEPPASSPAKPDIASGVASRRKVQAPWGFAHSDTPFQLSDSRGTLVPAASPADTVSPPVTPSSRLGFRT